MNAAEEILVNRIAHRAAAHRGDRALLVAVSGIDASGKSTIARRLEVALRARGVNAALITLDPWHHPAVRRFSDVDSGRHFYRHAFRFDELFGRLVDPLVRDRSVSLTLPLIRLVDDAWVEHGYAFADVAVVILEGIFLLKTELRARYDLSVWIDCRFETASRRALARNQEVLSRRRLVADYRGIYFPAQRLHFRRDRPRSFADLVLPND